MGKMFIFFRIYFITLGLLSITGYIILLYASFSWQKLVSQESVLMKIHFLLNVFLAPGLPVVLVTIYFLIYINSIYENAIGLLIVIFFLILHFVVSGLAAHAEPMFNAGIQVIELAMAIGTIVWNQSRR